jgi:hypothetical protein
MVRRSRFRLGIRTVKPDQAGCTFTIKSSFPSRTPSRKRDRHGLWRRGVSGAHRVGHEVYEHGLLSHTEIGYATLREIILKSKRTQEVVLGWLRRTIDSQTVDINE